MAELLAPLERAGIRVTLAMGDHDRRDNFLAQWPRYAENAPVPGRIVSKVDTPHCEILLADTVNDDPVGFGEGARPGHVDDAQRSWLEAELKAADKSVIVCGHHGPREGNVNLSKMLLAAPGARVAIGRFGEADGKHTPLAYIEELYKLGGVSEAFSAICLSRALGIAFAEGVEMFMPYELRDREFEGLEPRRPARDARPSTDNPRKRVVLEGLRGH